MTRPETYDMTNQEPGIFTDRPIGERTFERSYLASRQSESRLYTDEQVARLPTIDALHPHRSEWQVRRRSADRLCHYLQQKKRPLSILEVGCGNGWLASRLSAIPFAQVTGADINREELRQAERVFAHRTRLRFVYGSLDDAAQPARFDIIVFAASIQYFASLADTLNKALQRLTTAGEIHLVDSFFYRDQALAAARARSLEHYRSSGMEEMAHFYFHHPASALRAFRHTLLFNPAALINKLRATRDPFPWVRITTYDDPFIISNL